MNKLKRFYFKTYSKVAPKKASKIAFDAFQKVRFKQIRDREKSFFEEAHHFQVSVELRKNKSESIDCYAMGDETNPLVLLVHGWDSNAGSLHALAEALVEAGKYAVLFNLPGHAFYQSSATNLLECRNAFTGVLEYLNPTEPLSILSHSFGSAVVAYGLANSPFQVEKAVFLTNPNHVEDIFREFKQIIGLSDRAYEHLIVKAEEIIDQSLSELSVERNVRKAQIEELLLIHDQHDKVLSYKNAKAVVQAHTNAELVTLSDVGHYRMLWNEDVVKTCVTFLKADKGLERVVGQTNEKHLFI